MSRNEVCSGSKAISTASAWVPGLASVGLGISPPVQPARVAITPGCLRMSSWTPQKQPPARTAVSALSPIAFPLLAMSCLRLVLAAAAVHASLRLPEPGLCLEERSAAGAAGPGSIDHGL